MKREGFQTEILHSTLPKQLPSWLKALLFSRQICKIKDQTKNEKRQMTRIYFSLDRITCPDIYRAGDGVHKAFLQTKGFSLNPLHLSYLWLEKRTFKNARLIIANSHLVREQILRFYPETKPEKIHVVHNGVPIPERFNKPEAKCSLAEEFGFDPSLPVLLFVGSGFERKGVREFLMILSRLRYSCHAFIVGKEKHMGKYRKMARELGVADHVIFTGSRTDVERFYEGADLFLFPTRYEPFSNVIPEALSYGTVALTTRQNGASEILPKAWVMDRPNDLSIVETIDRFLSDPVQLEQSSRKARTIVEQYPIERNVRETLELIQRYFG
ncbi:glycosyltransferase family 4 protein [Nitratifractor sp.]|uniref:glycosyltransferase family 4 protein n=1 Tax=Nitratifractor sp. TaxID=2268144 RepID=UPI0025F034A9|nr:glycosyltransferase family 4 protein [Nitratifractor sp.]